jgi:hypothetical protein
MKDKQRKKLKELARNVIAHELGLEPPADVEKEFSDPFFHEKRGVFVTLKMNDELRGCIGNIEPVYPLYKAVMANAREAAFSDPRFYPVTREELNELRIEISVLSVLEKIEYSFADDLLEKLRPEKDGILIEKGAYKSTYLPQVWDEIKDGEIFLSSLCMKAGLPADEWKKGRLNVYRYEVEKF